VQRFHCCNFRLRLTIVLGMSPQRSDVAALLTRAGRFGRVAQAAICACQGALTLAFFSSFPHAARAQLVDQYLPLAILDDRASPVALRSHPDFEPPGTRIGAFDIASSVDTALGFDTNPAAQPQAHGSLAALTLANISAQSNWGRDSLYAFASVDDLRYPSQSAQSTTNWTGGTRGTIDLGRDILSLTYSHLSEHETPRDLSAPQLNTPVPYTVDLWRAAYAATFARFIVTPAIDYSRWRYQDAVETNGSVLSLSYQNRDVLTGSLTGRFDASGGHSILIVLRAVDSRYSTPQAGIPDRDSIGPDALAGVDYESDGVWHFRLLAGFQSRQFASSAYKTLSGPTVEANVVYQPTDLTTVTASLLHGIEDAALPNVSSFTLTQARIAVDHELRRNVLLGAAVQIDQAVYPQNAGQATIYSETINAAWLLNRRVRLEASYENLSRRSPPTSFSENITLVHLRLSL
jgi:hypothetical protein